MTERLAQLQAEGVDAVYGMLSDETALHQMGEALPALRAALDR